MLSVSLMAGFPYADVPQMGPAVIAVADGDRAAAQAIADELAGRMWEVRRELFVACPGPEEAVRLALASDRRPVVLVDLGDNVGGGSAGDGTVLLAELLRQGASGAVVVLYAPEAVEAAVRAGPGGSFERAVGGRVDRLHGDPIAVRGRGPLAARRRPGSRTSPGTAGRRLNDQGPTAVVEVEGPNLLVLNSLRTPPFSLGQLTSLGIDPAPAGDPGRQGGRRLQGGLCPDRRPDHRGRHAGPDGHQPGPVRLPSDPPAHVPARRLTAAHASEHAIPPEGLGDRHPLGQRPADEVLAADLLLGHRQRLLGDGARDRHDAVLVGQDQVARVDQDAAATDRDVVLRHVDPTEAVARVDPPAEDREPHGGDGPRVPGVAVDDHAPAAAIPGGGREQFAPEARSRTPTRPSRRRASAR